MKKPIVWSFLALIILSCNTDKEKTTQSQTTSAGELLQQFPVLEKQANHQAMVLGTFHFDYGMDASDVKGNNRMDIFSDENKQQLDTLIATLKKYNPTKIAIEWPPSIQNRVDSLYTEYKNGTWEIKRSEIYQIGFRLAKELNHPKVYCIDNRPPMPEAISEIDDLDVYADSLGQKELYHKYDDENAQFNRFLDSIQKTSKLLDILKLYNSTTYNKRSKQLWTTGLVNLGVYHDYAGTDLTGHWYRRNTRIFVNAANLATDKEERVLVVYGAMHKWILDELFESSPEFELQQVNTYLK